MATPKKTYTNEELNALVAEFSSEFDALVKAEVAKSGAALSKSENLRKDDDGSGDSGGSDDDKSPPKKDGPPAADASASGPVDASASPTAPAPASPAPDASASAPAADPAASAAGSDPMAALSQAYAQLSPDELAMHFQALKQVLMAGQAGAAGGAGAPPADPMAGAMGAAPAAPAAAPAAPPAGMPPAAGPDAVAPLAGEGSKPVDPAATMALKSEFQKELNLVKSERDAKDAKISDLEKSVEKLTDTLGKMLAQPMRKSIQGKDIAGVLATDPKPTPKFESMSKAEITKKLLVVANDPALKKSDRTLINNYYKGEANVDALAHLLS